MATLGEQLECIFGWKAHMFGDGIIPILEWGKVICALQCLLKKYHEKYPENNMLKKWVIDITVGAEKVFTLYEIANDEEEKELSDDESNSEGEDSKPYWDEILLPQAPTFRCIQHFNA